LTYLNDLAVELEYLNTAVAIDQENAR